MPTFIPSKDSTVPFTVVVLVLLFSHGGPGISNLLLSDVHFEAQT